MSADWTIDTRTVVGLLVGIAALGGYLRFVGINAVVGSLRRVPVRRAVSLPVIGSVPIVLWGTGLRYVLDGVGASPTLLRAIVSSTRPASSTASPPSARPAAIRSADS